MYLHNNAGAKVPYKVVDRRAGDTVAVWAATELASYCVFVPLLSMCLHTNAGAKVPYKVVDRRAGDTVAVWAATELAESLLGWKSKLTLADMCRDQWGWAQKYPQVGFVILLLAVCLKLSANEKLASNLIAGAVSALVVVELHLDTGPGL
jgi:UDP-glucose 4-epimerase